MPVPILVILAIAAIGAFVLHRTVFGRHLLAVGSSEDVARYSGRPGRPVRTIAYVAQGSASPWRSGLRAAPRGRHGHHRPPVGAAGDHRRGGGGTALRGGTGRVWGTVCGALILEIVGNIMVLSSFVSEYLIGAVQGAIIIVAMLVQRARCAASGRNGIGPGPPREEDGPERRERE